MNINDTRKFKIIAALIALSALFTQNVVIHLIVITCLAAFSFKRLRELKAAKFWIVFGVIAFLPAVFIRSFEAFYLSMLVFCRSLILYLALMTITENININKVSNYLQKLFGDRVAATLTLALNLMPVIRHIVSRNYAVFYLRRINANAKCEGYIGFVVSIFRQIISAADCCAENMILTHQAAMPHISIITGLKHSGKTTLALNLIEQFKAKNWPVTGVIAPSLIENNRRSTIYVKNIQSGEEKLLASRDNIILDICYKYGGFNFSQSSYDFARQALLDHQPSGIVFLDEFGPLEFANLGYANEFKKLIKSDVSAVFIILREELLTRFTKEFNFQFCDLIRIDLLTSTPVTQSCIDQVINYEL